ncbi:SDR family oxidoreductase [Marispirochaeta sp.]|uniref:SDR family NAD(P)-dependent oxidoreductase n=1 Tax=Marispirochaeta sp. TaxID=2038653 RepID=UPI0029C96A5D|nr:SDR family oxidoreductase [Marispirochaeta sp.]
MKLEGKVAVVTGGTGGLGWYICKSLAEEKAKIVLVYLNSRNKAEAYAKELRNMGTEAVAVSADVTAEEGIGVMTDAAESNFGGIDALVLNAAFNKWVDFSDLESLDPALWNDIINYNLTAPYLAMRMIGPKMKEKGGRIVTISSIAGLSPSGSSIAYCVSKAGLIHLTRCMSVALAPSVLVNSVAPGLMEGTRMTENLAPEYAEKARKSALIGKAADREDVAAVVKTFIKTDSITGQTLVVDGGKFFH